MKAHERRFVETCQPGQVIAERYAVRRKIQPSALTFVIAAPRIFGMLHREPRRELLRFIREMRHKTLVLGAKVLIDLRDTTKMYPDGTLLFAAELDRINRATAPKRRVRCECPRDDVVAQLFQHLGLYTMMGRHGTATVSADNVRYWRVKTGEFVEGEQTESLIEEYKEHFNQSKSAMLYNAITEAMTNSRQHAYTQDRGDATGKQIEPRWWMFSQLKDEMLFVAICDLGIGIRRSLLEGKTWPTAKVLEMLGQIGITAKDSRYIKVALELGRTRTKDGHRGKGFPELKAVIDDLGEGWLLVMSNRGMYSYTVPANEEKLTDFSDSILGTLILWRIPLPGANA